MSAFQVEVEEDSECCICYEVIGKKNNCVTECGHAFCFKCLATAMTHSNTCPCCRTPLVDLPEEDDDSEEDEYEENESDDESQNSDDESQDEDSQGEVEDVVERLQQKGLTMLDVVSMLLGRYSKRDEKYTDEFIDNMNKNFEEVMNDVDNECMENKEFGLEDINVLNIGVPIVAAVPTNEEPVSLYTGRPSRRVVYEMVNGIVNIRIIPAIIN